MKGKKTIKQVIDALDEDVLKEWYYEMKADVEDVDDNYYIYPIDNMGYYHEKYQHLLQPKLKKDDKYYRVNDIKNFKSSKHFKDLLTAEDYLKLFTYMSAFIYEDFVPKDIKILYHWLLKM